MLRRRHGTVIKMKHDYTQFKIRDIGLKKLAVKVAAYYARLEQGNAHSIKPSHVQKIKAKLRAKEEELRSEIEAATSAGDRSRLERKLQVAREQILRAEYLLTVFK